MVRPATWISSLALGLGMVCDLSVAHAQIQPALEPTPASAAPYENQDQDEQPGSWQTSADEYTSGDEGSAGESYSNDSGSGDSGSQSDEQPAGDDGNSGNSSEPQQPTTEIIKERFPGGAVKIEREVAQDAQGNYVNQGGWKMWDQRGNVVAQGTYDTGERSGTWTRWYRGAAEADLLQKAPYVQFVGPFISQATFKDGRLNGAWTIYDAKMHKISQWTFEDGRRQGPSTWWYPNGKKMRELQFKDGEMNGPALEWTQDGSVKSKDSYQSGRKLASKTSNHNGSSAKKSEGIYLMAKEVEQTPDDWWNFKLMTTTKTGKDERHGPFKSWYASGQVQTDGTYEHDMQVGAFTWWHANGQKALEGSFEQGKQNGAWTWWYPNGQKSIHGEYAHGNPTGRWTWWKEDGKVAQSADLSNSEGVVIESPKVPEPNSTPRLSKPAPKPKQPVKR